MKNHEVHIYHSGCGIDKLLILATISLMFLKLAGFDIDILIVFLPLIILLSINLVGWAFGLLIVLAVCLPLLIVPLVLLFSPLIILYMILR